MNKFNPPTEESNVIRTVTRTVLLAMGASLLMLNSCATNEGTVKAESTQAAKPVAAVSAAPDEKSLARGKEVFDLTCSNCHTVNGVANKAGPDLSDYGSFGFSQAKLVDMLRDYQRYVPGSTMPTWDAAYPKEDIEAVAAYIRSLKHEAFYLKDVQGL